MSGKKITGLVLMVVGILGGLYCLVTISNDMHPESIFSNYYTYQPPLTGHEVLMIFSTICCIAIAVVGLILLCLPNANKQVTYIAPTTQQPIAPVSTQTGFCRTCGSPLASNAKFCMKCGNPVQNMPNSGK